MAGESKQRRWAPSRDKGVRAQAWAVKPRSHAMERTAGERRSAGEEAGLEGEGSCMEASARVASVHRHDVAAGCGRVVGDRFVLLRRERRDEVSAFRFV